MGDNDIIDTIIDNNCLVPDNESSIYSPNTIDSNCNNTRCLNQPYCSDTGGGCVDTGSCVYGSNCQDNGCSHGGTQPKCVDQAQCMDSNECTNSIQCQDASCRDITQCTNTAHCVDWGGCSDNTCNDSSGLCQDQIPCTDNQCTNCKCINVGYLTACADDNCTVGMCMNFQKNSYGSGPTTCVDQTDTACHDEICDP